MKKLKVRLQPIVSRINLPTVLKTAILPGDSKERLFIATQPGVIYYIGDGAVKTLLDIRPRIIKLGANDGYDERGLLGMAFHPEFHNNGLFYLHYSLAGTQGPGALPGAFRPDPCNPETMNLKWTNRETRYDHIDTVEEWILQPNGQPQKRRTLLNLRRPFMNHNGVNSLNFSPETGRLVLTTGDGGSGFDPFNLSQDDMEIAGKIIEIDVRKQTLTDDPPAATRFDELPASVQETLWVIAKGVRNISGISYEKAGNQYIKYVGIVGQELVESIYSFVNYIPVPVTQLINAYTSPGRQEVINFGWRGWEGDFPASIVRDCPGNPASREVTTALYDDAVNTAAQRLIPLTCYYHIDSRPDKFAGTALTGVKPYMGNSIPELTGGVVFIDFARKEKTQQPVRGAMGYTRAVAGRMQSDYGVIETGYDFGPQAAYFVSLGTNLSHTRLYLGVYGSPKTTDLYLGTIFEVVPS